MFLALGLACHAVPTQVVPGESASGPTLRDRFGEHDFLTPRDAPATVALLDGGSIDTRAATCGGCHPDHAHEWGETSHAAATSDPQFTAELAKPDQPTWLCLNCHAPTAPQRAEVITLDTHLTAASSITAVSTTPNPEFDPPRFAEGVTCAACHVRRDIDGLGVVIGPRGSGRAPHRVRADKAALDGVCVSCHSPGAIVLSDTFPCWFTTAEELAEGPAAGESCVSCHMPETTRAAATGAPDVTLRRHTWTGGGIPKSVAAYTTLSDRGWRSGLDVAVTGAGVTGAGVSGTTSPLTVTLTNARAGHALPTGDPERFLRVEARLERAGSIVARDVLRLGQTWDWGDATAHRPAMRLADHRLGPGAARTWSPSLPVLPASTLVVEVMSVRLTPVNLIALGLANEAVPYPQATIVWRGTWPSGGEPQLATPAHLLADSLAFAALPFTERSARLDIPTPASTPAQPDR